MWCFTIVQLIPTHRISFSFLNWFTYFPSRGLFKKNQITVHMQIWSFYSLRWLRLIFLATQFGIWIGMVGHSGEFYFFVSNFVSFSQFYCSYFVMFQKNHCLKTVGSEFDNFWLFAIFRATFRMGLVHVSQEFSFVKPGFTCDCWDNPFAIFIRCIIFSGLSEPVAWSSGILVSFVQLLR